MRAPWQLRCRSRSCSDCTRHSSCCYSHGSGRRMGCTRHGSCCHSRASGRCMRHSSCAVACAAKQPQQLPSERPLDPRHGSCCRSRGCSCCMRHGSSCGSRGRGHGSGRVAAAIACATAAAAAVAAAAAARATAGDVTAMAAVRPAAAVRASRRSHGSGRRTQPSFRASVAPWRVGNSAREDASPVCRRFAAWHAARLMPPALRRSTCAGLAVGARPDARGGLLRKGERAERQQRAFALGTPPPGARPRMSRRPCGAGAQRQQRRRPLHPAVN